MPSYGFGRALSSPNPLMVLGQGVMGFGRALYDNDLDKKARGRQAALDQRTLDWRNDDLAYRTQRDAVEDQRHTQAVEEARRNQRFSRALAGYSEVDPVADAGADISEALETTRSYVPTPVPGSLGVGRLLRETAPTYSDGETSFRYDPLMDRGRMQAEELFDRQQGAAREADLRNFAQSKELAELQARLARGNASHAASLRPQQGDGGMWMGMQTSAGPILVNQRTGEARPVQVGGQTVQSKGAGGARLQTEGERKALFFYRRAEPAAAILNQFDNQKTLDAVASQAGMLGNWAKTPEGQRLYQAGKTWAMAVLRQDSGGAITEEEMQGYFDTYLPRPGDSAEVLAQKRDARRVVTDGLGEMGGVTPLARPNLGIHAAGAAANPYRR